MNGKLRKKHSIEEIEFKLALRYYNKNFKILERWVSIFNKLNLYESIPKVKEHILKNPVPSRKNILPFRAYIDNIQE